MLFKNNSSISRVCWKLIETLLSLHFMIVVFLNLQQLLGKSSENFAPFHMQMLVWLILLSELLLSSFGCHARPATHSDGFAMGRNLFLEIKPQSKTGEGNTENTKVVCNISVLCVRLLYFSAVNYKPWSFSVNVSHFFSRPFLPPVLLRLQNRFLMAIRLKLFFPMSIEIFFFPFKIPSVNIA